MNDSEKTKFAHNYYLESIEHRNRHKCGGYPFADGDLLNEITARLDAKKILEVGTAIGYSAYCFAFNNPVEITTIDMVEDHRKLAEENWGRLEVIDQIEMITGNSIDVLPTLVELYDIVFFDGFAPNPLEVAQYSRLIGENGVLISTNHSWNKTTPDFMDEIENCDLRYILKSDTAFSSKDENKIKMCVELWEKKFDTHSN